MPKPCGLLEDGIAHVQQFEDQNFKDRAALRAALDSAIQKLVKKINNKLTNREVLWVITVLKQAGADTHVQDAQGKMLDYYINDVQLTSEQDEKPF